MGHNVVRYLGAVTLMAVAALLLASCLSERGETIVSPVADCSLPLDGTVLGTTTTLVQIVSFTFVPAEIRIPAGTSVTWIYCEPPGEELHTSTSDTGVWDSPLLDREETFMFRFNEPGTFPYHCTPHPFMQATVIVE